MQPGAPCHPRSPPPPLALLLFYNAEVKTWDVIVIGGGIIGLSLAIALRKRGAAVLVVERGEPGREASSRRRRHAGRLRPGNPAALQPLATASARLYPEFAHELEIESGVNVDLRDHGTILFPPEEHVLSRPGFLPSEPASHRSGRTGTGAGCRNSTCFLPEGTQRRSPRSVRRGVEDREDIAALISPPGTKSSL